MKTGRIVILDFGSQYTMLIARRIRELGVFSEIWPPRYLPERDGRTFGVILSGGPASVYDPDAPSPSPELFSSGIPLLGICYGMQIMAKMMGGEVGGTGREEYGPAEIEIMDDSGLFESFSKKGMEKVWMSHGDSVTRLPSGFFVTARTEGCPIAAFSSRDGLFHGLQFHPEVIHTTRGKEMLKNFIFKVCPAAANWKPSSFIRKKVKEIRETAGGGKVICALSGGVDSSVVAALLGKAIPEQTFLIFVDNGLLRKGERDRVERIFGRGNYGRFILKDASRAFLRALRGVTDPEEKRRIVGRVFIETFEGVAGRLGRVDFLAQGTLYPDVIESISNLGPSAKIKSHHNVGGLPERMRLRLIEPLRELFKDEVRLIGKRLKLPAEIVYSHPFPGPGLSVRVVGEVTEERLAVLREATHIVEEEVKAARLYRRLWQAFAVLLPVKSVGVMGDKRTYEEAVALRFVESRDGMTARWARLPYPFVNNLSRRIINEVKGVNRVVYDVSSKPPSTIEWE